MDRRPLDAGRAAARRLSWGIFAALMGGLSDKIGRRKVLIPAILAFSLLSGFSGLAGCLMSLLAVRALMGVAEGSFCPTSFAATADAPHPKRRGFNLGLQQSGFALFGLALSPIIATQLLSVVTWRCVFALVSVPGLILGVLMFFVIREPKASPQATPKRPRCLAERGNWRDVLKSRNIPIAMAALFCAMTGVFVLGAMLPLYLTEYLSLDTQRMGVVVSSASACHRHKSKARSRPRRDCLAHWSSRTAAPSGWGRARSRARATRTSRVDRCRIRQCRPRPSGTCGCAHARGGNAPMRFRSRCSLREPCPTAGRSDKAPSGASSPGPGRAGGTLPSNGADRLRVAMTCDLPVRDRLSNTFSTGVPAHPVARAPLGGIWMIGVV
ncbi:hypothetical protein HDG33_001658 [Paraburkholderia sp. Cpub6]|nr:hypothetical protein [Paraburkholderia sp. Cpub6]